MIISFHTSKKGGLKRDVPIRDFKRIVSNKDNTLWIDIKDPNKDELALLAGMFGFHPLAVEDTVRFVELPKIDDYKDHLFVVFHKIMFNTETEKLKAQEIDFFLGKNYIVTIHRHKCEIIDKMIEKVEKNPDLLRWGADFVMHGIMDIAIDEYFPVLDKLDEKLEKLEREVAKSKTDTKTMEKLLNAKRNFGILKRSLNPQRDVINKLAGRHFTLVSEKATMYFKDIYDHIFRIYSTLESHNDLATVIFDAYLSTISVKLNETSNKMNMIMQKLTLVSTIFLPLTFIASVYGMNFKFMPELELHYGYFIVLVVMALISVWLWWFFKKRHLL